MWDKNRIAFQLRKIAKPHYYVKLTNYRLGYGAN